MANQNNGYLSNNSSQVNLRDWQHAARMFTDSNQIYGPKQNFLFHVAFHINKKALRNIAIGTTYSTQINMLVKSIGLPKFTVTTDKVNQYNRKKNVQQKISYEEVTVKFHDDNLGLINQLWQNYYNYYYADPSSASVQGAFNRTANKRFDSIRTGYGLDNGSTDPFFDYITVYQLAQGSYVSYKLINPIFTSWNHNPVDYANTTSPHEVEATIAYEAVEYGAGKVAPGDPEGFSLQNYDLGVSPLTGLDPTGASLQDISTTPNLQGINVVPDLKQEIYNNKIRTINNYQNNKQRDNTSTNVILNIINNVTNVTVNNNITSAFPVPAPSNAKAVATPVTITAVQINQVIGQG